MTKDEFDAWKGETAKSVDKWVLDRIHAKKSHALFYKGGVDGYWISVYQHRINMGRYEGAIPHIGDAVFWPAGSVEFSSNEATWKAILSRPGLDFLHEFYPKLA